MSIINEPHADPERAARPLPMENLLGNDREAAHDKIFQPVHDGHDTIVMGPHDPTMASSVLLPLAHRMFAPAARPHARRAVVIAPTRALCLELLELTRPIVARHHGTAAAVCTASPIDAQSRELASHPHIVCATPGRLLSHLQRGSLGPVDLQQIDAVVLYKANALYWMGLSTQTDEVLAALGRRTQTIVTLEALDPAVRRWLESALADPMVVSVEDRAAATLTHSLYKLPPRWNHRTHPVELLRVLETEQPPRAWVLCADPDDVEPVAESLRDHHYPACVVPAGSLAAHSAFHSSSVDKPACVVSSELHLETLAQWQPTHIVHLGPPSRAVYEQSMQHFTSAGRVGHLWSFVPIGDLPSFFQVRMTLQFPLVERTVPTASELRTRAEHDRLRLLEQTFASFEPSRQSIDTAARLFTHPDAVRMTALLMDAFFGTTSGSDSRASHLAPTLRPPSVHVAPAAAPSPPPNAPVMERARPAPILYLNVGAQDDADRVMLREQLGQWVVVRGAIRDIAVRRRYTLLRVDASHAPSVLRDVRGKTWSGKKVLAEFLPPAPDKPTVTPTLRAM